MPVLTSFVGRAEDARKLGGLLGEYRLVTGPGGVGKTRLACEVARQMADRYADGAWLVELAAVQNAAQVAAVVATALGVRQAGPFGAGVAGPGAVPAATASGIE